MVDCLETPNQRAGGCTERYDRVGVAILPKLLPTEIVRARTSGGDHHEITRRVGCDHGPGVGSAGAMCLGTLPGGIRWIPGALWHRIPGPEQTSAPSVEAAHFSTGRIGAVVVGDAGADHDDVADDCGW